MKVTITLDTDNAAFGDHPEDEIARILKDLAVRIVVGGPTGRATLRDINGNTVGLYEAG